MLFFYAFLRKVLKASYQWFVQALHLAALRELLVPLPLPVVVVSSAFEVGTQDFPLQSSSRIKRCFETGNQLLRAFCQETQRPDPPYFLQAHKWFPHQEK